jgi:hypothetical protein
MASTTGRQRNRFSTRRKALLALVLVAFAVVAWMSYIGAAGISGIATKDMDWDGDGTVTRQEILQSFHAVVVTRTSEGQRECSAFYWRRDKRPIRVDCRTTMAVPATEE